MFFVQSRIGMNDVYVGLFIIAAYTVFAAIWTGWWKGRAAFWMAMPVIGVLLGLALASKWVAAYAIGALLLLILVRSALGRVLAILGLIGITGVLGYMAISVPAPANGGDPGFGNLTFLFIMIALTLLAVVVAVVHPIAWTDEEMRFAVDRARRRSAAWSSSAPWRPAGSIATIAIGSLTVTPLLLAIALGLGSLVVVGLFWLGGRYGFGPLAGPPAPDDPIRLLDPPGTPPDGWLRPGWGLGVPVVWALALHDRPPARGLRPDLHPVGADREPPADRGLAGGPHRPDAARPDRPDVRLPQRPDRGPPGVLAVVGMADEPEARLVLPGGARRRHLGRALRRGQPRHLVARDPGAGVRLVDGVQAPEPGADAHRRRRSPPSGSRGPASTGPPSSTTTTRRCRSS